MHDHDAVREAERAIARWSIGDMDLPEALRHACHALGQGRPAACAIVHHAPAELLGLGVEELALMEAGATEAGSKEHFLRIALEAGAGAVDTIDAVDTGDDGQQRWTLCAPASGPDGDVHGWLVVVGRDDDARTFARTALEPVSRICGAMLASDDARRTAATVAHKMNNLLAAALANVSYACTVVEDDGDLAKALKNTKESASLVATHAHRLVRLATRGR